MLVSLLDADESAKDWRTRFTSADLNHANPVHGLLIRVYGSIANAHRSLKPLLEERRWNPEHVGINSVADLPILPVDYIEPALKWALRQGNAIVA